MIDDDTIVIYLNDIVISDPSLKPPTSSQSSQSNANSVTLTVRSSKDEHTKFKIGGKDKFQKLFDGYCKKLGIQPNTIKFVFDGETLDLDSTPEDEDMEDGDIIDVHTKKK